MTSVSLSDLKAKRAAMTQGEWEHGEDAICTTESSGNIYVGSLESTRDATGIVATHNAADVLIECVSAALAYRDAKAFRDAFGATAYKADQLSILTEDFQEQCAAIDAQIRERERELLAAIAKVAP